jgi:hypothetical protein
MESDERYYDAVYDMRALTQDDEDEDENENEAYASALDDDVDDGNDDDDGARYVEWVRRSVDDMRAAREYATASGQWGQPPSEEAMRAKAARKLLARQLLGLEPEDAPAAAVLEPELARDIDVPAPLERHTFRSREEEEDAEAEAMWRQRRERRDAIIDGARSSGDDALSDSERAARRLARRRAMKANYQSKLRRGYVDNDVAARVHFSQ